MVRSLQCWSGCRFPGPPGSGRPTGGRGQRRLQVGVGVGPALTGVAARRQGVDVPGTEQSAVFEDLQRSVQLCTGFRQAGETACLGVSDRGTEKPVRLRAQKSNMMKLQIDLTSSDLHPVRSNVDSYAVKLRDTKID